MRAQSPGLGRLDAVTLFLVSEAPIAIEFAEYKDSELPDLLRAQVLAFLRIVWPDGFVGSNRFRSWTSHPSMTPFHQLYAAGSQLVSHLEIVTVPVTVNDHEYRAFSPTAVLTYPAFRGEGWSSRLNAAAVRWIDASDADIGLLTCSPDVIGFYSKAGWTHAQDATIVVGPEGVTWLSDDVLLTWSRGERSREPLLELRHHPLRVHDEW